MRGLQEHLDDLDRMVDTGAEKANVRSQIAFIGREVAALEADYTNLAEAHAQLQREKAGVEQQLNSLKSKKSPADNELSEQTKRVLKLFFDSPHGVSETQISRQLQISVGMAKLHIDTLLNRRLITQTSVGFSMTGIGHSGHVPPGFEITPAGREYCAGSGLAS